MLSIWATQDPKVRQVEQEVQLTAPESRVVDLVLPGAFGRLSGRVVDATGSPVRGAALQLGQAASQFWEIQRLTDEDGAFDFGALPVGNTDLRVSSTKHAYWHAPEHEVAADSRPLTIRLEAGTQVIVKVVDSQGRPAVGADIHALDRFATTDAEGQAVIPHLPLGRVNIEVLFQGAKEVVQHETAIPTVTIALGTSPR